MAAPRPVAISHRGAHDALPENSLPAILRAIELGAQGIELDVHATVDDTLVVHHDPDLKDGRRISSLRYREISDFELAPGIGIPRLDALLEAVGTRATVFIETKQTGIEMLLLRAVRNASAECAVHSFDAVTVSNIKSFMPSLRAGLLTTGAPAAALSSFAATRADDLWHLASDIDRELVRAVHAEGKSVIAWTSNEAGEWKRLSALSVDGICTDNIGGLAAAAW